MPWRSKSLPKLNLHVNLKRKNSSLETIPSTRNADTSGDSTSVSPNIETNTPRTESLFRKDKGGWNMMVTIVIVEAKDLPRVPDDGSSHGLYCKFRLGGQSFKSKSVLSKRHPQWRERFKLHLNNDPYLRVTLVDKGKQKNFMGSCVLDLSHLEKERTHDIWEDLDGGYGSVHISVTMCNTRKDDAVETAEYNVEELRDKYALSFYNLTPNLDVVGQLRVKVICGKGFYGKPIAYCTLTLDNEKVQTPCVGSSEPMWNKSFVFNVYDVTSVLELKVLDFAFYSFLNDFLGRVSIPLLRITDGEPRWYALKDANRRKSAKGNCPRVLLDMSMVWNPVTASLKLFQPKRVKYIQKPPKFDLTLVYKNIRFIKEVFDFLYEINEGFKRLFEGENRDYAFAMLCAWLAFWYYFSPWMTPLLILLPFLYYWYFEHKRHQELNIRTYHNSDGTSESIDVDERSNEESLADKIQGLPEMTFTITDGIEYLMSIAERLYNLATLKVPFLSFLTMILLIGSSVVLYYIPFKFLMMAFGLYKFGRKQWNPQRLLNNDIIDFISRIPDNRILKDWRELAVPEPNYPERRNGAISTVTACNSCTK